MAGKYKTYSPEFKEEAARLVIDTSRPIADVARELQISETSLGNWTLWITAQGARLRRFAARLLGPGLRPGPGTAPTRIGVSIIVVSPGLSSPRSKVVRFSDPPGRRSGHPPHV